MHVLLSFLTLVFFPTCFWVSGLVFVRLHVFLIFHYLPGLAGIEAAAEWRMRDFSSQDLANAAWAFAKAGQKEEQLFMALAAAAERRMRDFN